MHKLRQVWAVCAYNFRQWWKNPRIFIVFSMALVLCFLLSDKAVQFAIEQGTTMQLVEAFVWTFGDSTSILLTSLLLILLFADMPFITMGTPFFLMRTSRKVWLTGQILYIVLATALYMVFILTATCVMCARISFVGNQWSETAAILGYSGAGKNIALPASVKTMELSRPYACMGSIFLLMLLYALLLVVIMLAVNIRKGQRWSVGAVFAFSAFGILLKSDIFMQVFDIPDKLVYKANVAIGWLSPLNHATYHMHNFGYDMLPTLEQTYLVFSSLILLILWIAMVSIRNYNFNFIGNES